ncbi:MAG: hypothetical protein J0I20_15655 [Chloroflexi bacterium]|nr:hypothetical protein [Chloroflexota bacterium]
MGTLLIMAIVVIGLIVLAAYFVMKYVANKSGGNDDVWQPRDKGPHPEG